MNTNNNQALESLSVNSEGKATTTAMLLCVAAVTCYLKVGREYCEVSLQPFYHTLVLLTLAIVTAFTLGCALHMVFIGDRSSRELRRDLNRQIAELISFVSHSLKRIRKLEADSLLSPSVRPSTTEDLNQVRRIVAAIGRRAEKVSNLLKTRDQLDLIDASDLINQELEITENCMESLIGAEPIAPLAPEEWFHTVESMCNEIERDLLRVRIAA